MDLSYLKATKQSAWCMAVVVLLICALALMDQIAFAVAPTPISDMLEGKPVAERANMKATEIVSRMPVGEYQSSAYGLRISIVSILTIDRGVEVLVRAWKGPSPLGFGTDGAIETEKIRVYNPPILVRDSAGSVVREWQGEDGEMKKASFREDPVGALRDSIAHTVGVIAKSGGAIVPGSVGNTTSTFYPDADTESTSVDGHVESEDASWSMAQTATAGDAAYDNIPNNHPRVRYSGSLFNIARAFYLFDTSPLSSGVTISASTLSLYDNPSESGPIYDDNDAQAYLNVYGATPASNTSIGTDDFEQVGSTAYATAIRLENLANNGYSDFVLNSTGLAAVSKTGVTKFSVREGHDVENVAIDSSGVKANHLNASAADKAGTTEDPKLIVVHLPLTPDGARKPATETTSSDTSLSDDADLGIGVQANKKYEISGVILASSTSHVPDIKVAFTVPAGAEMDIMVIPSSSSATQAELLQTSGAASGGIPLFANQPVGIHVMGTIKTGSSSGTLKLQWAQNQSDSAAVGVLRGSYLQAEEI